jgi:ATP-dependent Lon protease
MVVMPRQNQKDLADVPDDVVDQLDIHFVDTIDEVLKLALQPAAAA